MLCCGMTEWICNYLSATQLVDKCISYLFLYNILPQTLKVTHICFLSRLIWVKGLVSASESHKAAVKVSTGAEEWSTSKITHGCRHNSGPCRLFDWGPRFLAGCWPEATLSSLPHKPLHRAAFNLSDCLEQASERGREYLIDLSLLKKRHPITFALFCPLKVRH